MYENIVEYGLSFKLCTLFCCAAFIFYALLLLLLLSTVLQCPPSPDAVPYCDEAWTPSAGGLAEWAASQEQRDEERRKLFLFNEATPSHGR
jgi:hypothetical protein